MKCKSCDENISSKFKHSIQQNQCPFCGNEITDATLNGLFRNLFELIGQFAEYETELKEWMFENLNMVDASLVKKTSTQFPAGVRSIKEDLPDEVIEGGVKQRSTIVSARARAGVKEINDDELKAIKAQIAAHANGGVEFPPKEFDQIPEQNRDSDNDIPESPFVPAVRGATARTQEVSIPEDVAETIDAAGAGGYLPKPMSVEEQMLRDKHRQQKAVERLRNGKGGFTRS